MEIWPKNDDAPRVLFLDDDVSTEGTVRITIEDDSDTRPLLESGPPDSILAHCRACAARGRIDLTFAHESPSLRHVSGDPHPARRSASGQQHRAPPRPGPAPARRRLT